MDVASEMVLLSGKIGSKVVTVLCPNCGRISRQIARVEYASQPSHVLRTEHTCPICETVYSLFSEADRNAWSVSFSRYEKQGEQSYNSDVKSAYQEKPNTILQTGQSYEPQYSSALTDTIIQNIEKENKKPTISDEASDLKSVEENYFPATQENYEAEVVSDEPYQRAQHEDAPFSGSTSILEVKIMSE